MNIGSHVSTRNGYLGAAVYAQEIGCKSFQYFSKNPRNLMTKKFSLQDAESCAHYCLKNGLSSIAHTAYPTNLAIGKGEKRDITEQSIINDLHIADACGSVGIIVHYGKYKGTDPLQGYRNILMLLNRILEQWHGKTLFLLENQAGGGGKMGITMEEMVQIRNLCAYPEKVGFCLDTCHAFASGLWNGENWHDVIEKGEQLGYFEHVKAVHLNDSFYPSHSFRDRHANVGKGYIGEHNIKLFLLSSFLEHIPVVLETPTSARYSHKDEIKYVLSLI